MAGIAAALVVDEIAVRLTRRARRTRMRAEAARRDIAATRAKAEGTVAGARKATAASAWGARKAAVSARRATTGTMAIARKTSPARRRMARR